MYRTRKVKIKSQNISTICDAVMNVLIKYVMNDFDKIFVFAFYNAFLKLKL